MECTYAFNLVINDAWIKPEGFACALHHGLNGSRFCSGNRRVEPGGTRFLSCADESAVSD